MAELHCPLAESFSLTRGGPFHRPLVRLGHGEAIVLTATPADELIGTVITMPG